MIPANCSRMARTPQPTPSLTSNPADVAAALQMGGLVLFPTETLWVVCAHAADATAMQALREAIEQLGAKYLAQHGSPPVGRAAWFAPSVAGVRHALTDEPHESHESDGTVAGTLLSPLHSRALDKLLPGPVALDIEQPGRSLVTILQHAGTLHSAAAPGGQQGTSVLVTVPAGAAARAILTAAAGAGVQVVGGWVTVPGIHDARTSELTLSALANVGVVPTVVFDPSAHPDHAPPAGEPPTVLVLTARGGWALESAGLLPEREVERRMRRRVLFVCTGNTCRSPMAQAIARGVAARMILRVPTDFVSAGLAASSTSPFSPETRGAVERLGFDPPRGTSRALSEEMLNEADAVFVMTRSHLRGVTAMAPHAATKVQLLDRADGEVTDPVGGPQALYDSTARAILPMVERRLAELEVHRP